MNSITGIEINNPNVCIKSYRSNFACMCEDCLRESQEIFDKFFSEEPLQEQVTDK